MHLTQNELSGTLLIVGASQETHRRHKEVDHPAKIRRDTELSKESYLAAYLGLEHLSQDLLDDIGSGVTLLVWSWIFHASN